MATLQPVQATQATQIKNPVAVGNYVPTTKPAAGSPGLPPPQVGTSPADMQISEYNNGIINNNEAALLAQGYSQAQVNAMYGTTMQHEDQLIAATANEQAAQASGNPWERLTAQQALDSVNSQPVAPGYVPGWTMQDAELPGYEQEVAANSDALNNMRSQAENQGLNPWATAAELQAAQTATNQRDAGVAQTAASNAQAEDQLAAQGGLSSGARERVAEGGQKNYIGMEQGINQNLQSNDLQVATQDQQNKLNQLGTVAQDEQNISNGWMNAKNTDVQNQAQEDARLNAYNQNLYNQQMQNYAAIQQANATANSGKK